MRRFLRKVDLSLRIRAANVEDVPAILEIERQSSSAAHWPRQQYENLFAVQNGLPGSFQRLAWVLEKEADVPEKDPSKSPEILAFLVAQRIEAEWELENIVVAETARRQGLGTLLLREFLSHVQMEGGSGIFLEVRESNQNARTLYRKLGFEEAGSRRNYYTGPVENAILYRLWPVKL